MFLVFKKREAKLRRVNLLRFTFYWHTYSVLWGWKNNEAAFLLDIGWLSIAFWKKD